MLAGMLLTPFLTALCLQAAAPAPPAPALRDLAAVLKPIREKHDVPGLVAVVVEDSLVVAQGADGVRKRGESERITVDDRMHIGSCTKSMTATLCAILIESGKLAWDTKVVDMFPELARSIDAGWSEARLVHLLTNHGGAPGDPEPALWMKLAMHPGTPREQRMELVRGVLSRPPAAKPGTKFIYSNMGFSIAGAMAERATDTSYEELMRTHLFQPLGMKSAGFGAPGTRGKLDEPRGHGENGQAVEVGPRADNPIAIAPAGRAHCSLPDWARYVIAHIDGEADRDDGRKHLLPGRAFQRLHAPFGDDEERYACGWIAGGKEGDRTLWHNGSNTMWYAEATVYLDRRAAVLVATNQFGKAGRGAVADAMATLCAGLQKRASPSDR